MRTLLSALTSLVLAANSYCQKTDNWTVSVAGSYLFPTGSFGSQFAGAPSYRLKVGRYTDIDFLWELRLEGVHFDRTNSEALNSLVRDLSLRLDFYGGAAEGTYFFEGLESSLRPFIAGSAGMYRWFYKRGSHYAVGKDAVGSSRLDTTHFLDEFQQSDWSAGFTVGAGVGVDAATNLELYVDARYGIIIGEIWQALSLELENVSGMQMASVTFGIRYDF